MHWYQPLSSRPWPFPLGDGHSSASDVGGPSEMAALRQKSKVYVLGLTCHPPHDSSHP